MKNLGFGMMRLPVLQLQFSGGLSMEKGFKVLSAKGEVYIEK